MSRKRLIRYVLIFIAAVLTSFLLPILIRAGTTLLISRIEESRRLPDQDEALTEADPQAGSYSLEGMTETSKDAPGKDNYTKEGKPEEDGSNTAEEDQRKAKEQEQKEARDRALSEYENSFHPEVDGTKSGLYEIFIADREAAFLCAVADFLYPVYGDALNVTKIEIADFINDDDAQLTCQILLHVQSGTKEELAFYYAAYNKRYDFYSIYAYHE